jgi:tetratricopeptide (TPR) repeat protein
LFGLLGFCLARSGNPLASESAYLQAYALDPDNADWLEGLLSSYLDSEQFARAESLLRQLVRIKPKEARMWLLLGNVILSQGRKIDAIAALETGLSLKFLDNDGMMMLGDLYAEQMMFPDAVRTYQALAAAQADLGVERLVRYASALTAEEDMDRAAQVLDAAAKLATGDQETQVLHARAGIHQARAEWDEARELLERVVELDPLNGRALYELGQAEEELGDDARALFHYEAAAQRPDQAYGANLSLANLHVKQLHFEDALAAIEQALSLQRTPALLEFQARVRAMSRQTDE